MREIFIIIVTINLLFIFGCTKTSVIQPVATSESGFDSALIYKGKSVKIADTSPGGEEFRVFEQGATGFVPVSALQSDTTQRAIVFCEGKGQTMKPLRETTSQPPHMLGNVPRTELIFECIDKPVFKSSDSNDDIKYTKLVNLKKLLDSGIITQKEFDQEKAKILNK